MFNEFHRSAWSAAAKRRIAAVAILLPSLTAAGAVGPATAASSLRVAVWDATTKNELDQLAPGDVLTLDQGSSVILRLYTPAGTGGSSQRTYVSGAWRVADGGSLVELTAVDQAKGSAQVRGVAAPQNPKNAALLRFRTADARHEEGAVGVFVRPAATPGNSVKPPGPGLAPVAPAPPILYSPQSPTTKRAEQVVQSLYLGILLREPDATAQTWMQQIDRTDYAGLVEVAQKIAASDESRVQLYARADVTPQQRLAALYRHLLGLESDRVQGAAWNANLDRVAPDRVTRGDVSGVVADLVRTGEFRSRFGFDRGLGYK
jgi:hypothetical protein